MCRGSSKTFNTKHHLQPEFERVDSEKPQGVCVQAVGTTCFVGFFLPREIPFLMLKFSMSNDSSWNPGFCRNSCDWGEAQSFLSPFLITSGEYIEICRLSNEVVFGLSGNLPSIPVCPGLAEQGMCQVLLYKLVIAFSYSTKLLNNLSLLIRRVPHLPSEQ